MFLSPWLAVRGCAHSRLRLALSKESLWRLRSVGEGRDGGVWGRLGGISEPYLNLLMFFSDTRMKSTMG